MAGSNVQKRHPLVGKRLRRLLGLIFFLFALLVVNSSYLGAISLLEAATDERFQDYFYLLMFLLHLLLGLLLILPFLLFGLIHQQRARLRSNRYAIRAGMALFVTGLTLLISGLILTRFGFFEINHPTIRNLAYWLHVTTPFLAVWLFLVHRLAGPVIRWRAGGYWATAALLFAAGMSLVQITTRNEKQLSDDFPYAPAFVRISGEPRIPAQHLMQDEVCAECHADIAQQMEMSMHRFSSFNNPAYRFSIDEARAVLLERDNQVTVARLCAACHDQVPLFSGRFDDPDYKPDNDPGSQAGISCIGCHSITGINSPRGNGSYDFEDPPNYPFAFSDNPLLRAVNRQLIKAKPAYHKMTFLKPVHRSAEFCSTCHKVHLPYALNHYKWLRGQNHYDSFLLSGVSGHRVDSFYYPAKAVANCAHCHMPLVRSDDPAARDFDNLGERSVHNHLFAAANTGVPHLLGQPDWTREVRRNFLLQAARVDLFGLRQEGDIDGALHAPLRPELPVLEPKRRYLLELVVRTLGIGHQLTQGTSDSNELWLDLTLKSGERIIGRSGSLDAAGNVDPWSYFINSYLLDKNGMRIERRNAQDIFVALYDHQIPPGAATTVHYALQVPEDITGPITIEAKLQYRKFDSRFLGHVQGEAFTGNDLPIITLAEDSLILPVAGGTELSPAQDRGIPSWERWNDYGIGLLRKGKRELRQAEAAFRQVERLQPEHGAINLARVHFREGRLTEAAEDLQRAAGVGAPAWTLAWYSAQVDREFGNLDQAISKLQALIDTRFQEARERGFDFSKDYRVLNELGRTLYERARQERGKQRQSQRREYLEQARDWLEKAMELDPENVTTHYNLALVSSELGEPEKAATHRSLHEKYRPDDQAIEQAVTLHRSRNPAADHAAEETAVYDLQRKGTYGLPSPTQVAFTSQK